MKRVFRYQMRVYAIYLEFGEKPFYTKSALAAMNKLPFKSTPITYINLVNKGLLRGILKEEEKEIEDFSYRRMYRKISAKGLQISKTLDENKNLITKFLLRL